MCDLTPFFAEIQSRFPVDFLTRDPQALETYGRDWTKVYRPRPSAVVFPRTTDEVSRFAKLCTEHRVALVPSGGRTGLAGGAVAAHGEIVLSFVRMNHLGPVDCLAHTLRVQAGAVTEAVHKHCEPHGLTWPIDFASKGSSQVGGNISTNAGGVRVIHYGMTRNWVLGLQVVLMNGEVLELNGALEKNNTGIDLRQLFIGTEGTLGIITEATLKLIRLPEKLDVFFFAVQDMKAVFQLLLEARRAPFTLMAFECLTHPCLEAVTVNLNLKSPFGEQYGAYVLMEVERPSSADAQAVLDGWLSSLFEKGLVLDGTLAQSPREARELWMLREGVAESLARKAFLHKNDIALPISELEFFVAAMGDLFRDQYAGIDVYFFGHIGDGNLHVNALQPEGMSREAFVQHTKAADRDLFALVQKHRGSVSAEHGIGLLKKGALAYSRTPVELELFRAMKKIFDPLGLLNPGKILD
ncbi:FAD-binding oxidoreductase [Bdellovibrionota bacterium FG-1]